MSADIVFKGSSDFSAFALNTWQVWGVDDTPASNEFINHQLTFREGALGQDSANFTPFDFTAAEAIGDYVAIGQQLQFGKVYFYFFSTGTAGVGGTGVWEYWNGATWAALGGVTDGTSGFTSSSKIQTLTFTVPGNWAQLALNGRTAYYIRFRLTAVYTTNPAYAGGRCADYRNTPGVFAEVWSVDDTPASNEIIDNTIVANDPTDANFPPFNFAAAEAIGDFCAVGMRQRFGRIRVDYANGTAGVGGTIAVEYWNGTIWTAVAGLTDGTSGFTAAVADNLIISFTVPGDWAKTTISTGESLYFIRFRVTATYSTNPVLDQIFALDRDLLLPIGARNQSSEDPFDVGFSLASDPLRFHTNGFVPRDLADEEPAATFEVPRVNDGDDDLLLIHITLIQENDDTFDIELEDDVGVFHTFSASPDSNGITTEEISIAKSAATSIWMRALLTGGENPGDLFFKIRARHPVTVSGTAIQAIDSPSTTEGLANFAQMHFGNSASSGNYMPANGYYASTSQPTREQRTECPCPIDGTITVIVLGTGADAQEVEVWKNGVSEIRLTGALGGGDERDHYAIFKGLAISVAKGDLIAIQNQENSGATWCQVFITPDDGVAAPMQYWFGGDMMTADRAMQWMSEANGIEIALDNIRTSIPILYDGIISEVILSREVAGTTFQLRINGVNSISPIQVFEGDILQVASVAGAAVQNWCIACVNVQPDDVTKTGILVPYAGDPGADWANNQAILHGIAAFGMVLGLGSGAKFTPPRDVRVKRATGLSELGALEVALGVDQQYVNFTASDVALGRASLADILPSEDGLPLARNTKMNIRQRLGGSDSVFLVYAE